jgi:glycerol-3-phosphate acyltransferase PlsY
MDRTVAAGLVWGAVVAVVGYLLGSITVADLVTRRRGAADLRQVGDRNPGYWNAKETLGRRAAVPVFVGDAAKGALAAGVGVLVARVALDPSPWWFGYLGGGAAMIGHAWPVFARFRGGRSILAFAGTMCVVAPLSAAIAIGALLAITLVTRSFAWGARIAVFGVPAVQLVVDGPERTAATGVLMSIIGLRFAMAAVADRRAASAVGQP